MTIFPDNAGLARLASAPAIERNQKWMERRYLTMAGGTAIRS